MDRTYRGYRDGCPIGHSCIYAEDEDCFNLDTCEVLGNPIALPYFRNESGLYVNFHRDLSHEFENGLKIYNYADLPQEWQVAWSREAWVYPFRFFSRDGFNFRRVAHVNEPLRAVGFEIADPLPYTFLDDEVLGKKVRIVVRDDFKEFGFAMPWEIPYD